MTKEEKNEKYRKNREKQIKSRKTQIIVLIVIPIIGAALTFLLITVGKSRQNDIEAATVLDSMSIGEFLEKNESGSAIYSGTIKAVDPAFVKGKSGDYIMAHIKVEREEKTYNEETKKYDSNTTTLSDDSDTCEEIEIDDVTVPYKAFHELPIYTNTKSEGPDSNLEITTFSFTPEEVEGTFFLKCDKGKVSSARYYGSEDVAGESRKVFNMAKILIWVTIIVIEICLVFSIIKKSKMIKNIDTKIN